MVRRGGGCILGCTLNLAWTYVFPQTTAFVSVCEMREDKTTSSGNVPHLLEGVRARCKKSWQYNTGKSNIVQCGETFFAGDFVSSCDFEVLRPDLR